MKHSVSPYLKAEVLTALSPDWQINQRGLVHHLDQITGYGKALAWFKYAYTPDEIIANDGVRPLVASRRTPESQKKHHLERLVSTPISPEKMSLIGLARAQFESSLPPEFNFDQIPMLDCAVFFPTPTNQQLLFAGFCKNEGRNGVAMIIDGDRHSVTWVTNDNSFTTSPSIIPLAAKNDGKLSVFSITGALSRLSAQTVTDNSITAVVCTTNEFPKIVLPRYVITPKKIYDEGFWSGKRWRCKNFGANFAQRGENVDTQIKTTVGELDDGLKHAVMLNIFPMVLPPQLEPKDMALLQQM